MKTIKLTMMGALLTLTAAAGAASIADGRSLDDAVRGAGQGIAERGQWHNRYMAAGTGVAGGTSADEAFMRSVAYYTRPMLDRGGWDNAFVATTGYSAGNPLLAARVGEGVTTAAV